jgi:hypothetical protein
MKILILSEAYNDKYFAIIDDIVKREQNSCEELSGSIIDICSNLKPFMNLSSENRLGAFFNTTFRDYKKFVKQIFESQNIAFESPKLGNPCRCEECERIVQSILNDSGTTSFATMYQRSKDFDEYPTHKKYRFKKLIGKLFAHYTKILNQNHYDKVFIPSGKNSWGSALARASSIVSPTTKVYFYDSFGSEKNYFCELYKPTDLNELQNTLDSMTTLKPEEIVIAESWFQAQSNSKAQNFFLSTENLQGVPNNNNPIYAFFTSSEDEFIGLPKWSNSIFSSQYAGFESAIKEILSNLDSKSTIIFRFHPHSKYKSIFDNLGIAKAALRFREMGCEVILPHQKTSALSIIEKADKVIVWNSTVGIESAYLGIPTYNLAEAIYSNLGATIYVKRLTDIWSLPNLNSSRPETLKYGFYMATTTFPIKSWNFYPKNRYATYVHYLLFANHQGIRSRIRLNSNLILFRGLSTIFFMKSRLLIPK